MKLIAALFFITISFTTSAQKIEKYYDYKWQETDASNARFYSIIQNTDSGWYRMDYYINLKTPQMIGLYKDSDCKVENGTFYYFYPNGNAESIKKYVNGKREGTCVEYHESGLMHDSALYKDDHPLGMCLSWYSNGFLADSAYINENGSGIYISWFDNGNISSAGYFSEGHKMNGTWQFFHNNGKLASLETYQKGIFDR